MFLQFDNNKYSSKYTFSSEYGENTSKYCVSGSHEDC